MCSPMLPLIITLSAFQCSGSVNLRTRARRNIRGGGYKKSAQELSASFSTFLERPLTLALEPTSERFFPSEHSLVNCRMEAQINRIRSERSEACVTVILPQRTKSCVKSVKRLASTKQRPLTGLTRG